MAFAQFRCRVVAQNRPPVVTDFQARLRIVFRSSSQAVNGVIGHGAVPLPVDPLLSAPDLVAGAAEAGARLVLVPAERIPALADLTTEPPVPIEGTHGCWAAALRAP
jgi:hypothetical protein